MLMTSGVTLDFGRVGQRPGLERAQAVDLVRDRQDGCCGVRVIGDDERVEPEVVVEVRQRVGREVVERADNRHFVGARPATSSVTLPADDGGW